MCEGVCWDSVYIYRVLVPFVFPVCFSFLAMANPNMLDKILSRLQNAEIVEDEEDFFLPHP